jgi:type VI secretion system secreted protein VgrG
VFGLQTATVTGPQGEEIHTDVHGRVKVLFHWDRLSAHDDSSSCWVRVAQMWAGPGWGTWFLPRIGMEVVVDFLDGNPDRPLVVGCVYNGRNGTPYPLPDEKTKSTIKTNSSVGGEGFNEIRFEDAKGAEEIFIHAQRDQNERVLNNRTRLVKGNEWVNVEGNKKVQIDGSPVHGDPQGIVQGRETRIDGHEILEYPFTPDRMSLARPWR